MSEHAEKILATIDAGTDTSALAASWRRCLTLHRVDPDRVRLPERDSTAWRAASDRDGRMIAVARDSLDELFRMFADAECGVYLADRGGMVLDMLTNGSVDSWKRRPEEVLGTTYSERALGTCGVGTCLAEQRGLIIRGPQHYLARFTPLTCVSAPLFGSEGELIGCLVVAQKSAAYDVRLDAFLSITIASFARRIETELFAQAFPNTRLMLASPLGRQPGALLAVDSDDCVVGATRAARRLLDLSSGHIARAVGVDQLLERQLDESAGGGGLREAERRAIERALARCDGNMTLAAKTIGISRSTLYRKMDAYELPRGR